jgi:hypothetical protein
VGAKNAKVGKEYSAGKSYVVFGKQHNTNTIDLSDIAYGIGGFSSVVFFAEHNIRFT